MCIYISLSILYIYTQSTHDDSVHDDSAHDDSDKLAAHTYPTCETKTKTCEQTKQRLANKTKQHEKKTCKNKREHKRAKQNKAKTYGTNLNKACEHRPRIHMVLGFEV